MNFLFKSISNFQFPYALDQSPLVTTPLWQATNGTKKADSSLVTVFTYTKQKENTVVDALVSNAVHNSKILKLPGLVRVVDVIDSDQTNVYVVTERVSPLVADDLSVDALNLGIYQIAETLNLLHEQAKVLLGTICPGTIFVNERGEWCLFGLELCSKVADPFHLNQYAASYASLVRGSSLEIEPSTSLQVDSVLLAKLIQIFYKKIPHDWNSLVAGLSQGRITIPQFCVRARTSEPFQSPLIAIYNDLKELHIKDPQGKVVIMADLQRKILDDTSILRNGTKGFVDGLLIPEVSQCVSTIITAQKNQPIAASFASIIPFVATIFELTCSKQPISESEQTFDKYVKPLIFENFKISDRQLRFLLLVYFPIFVTKLTNNDVVERVFPQFVQGLADSDSTIRIQTLKRVPDVISMITERQLNNDLLRHLAKTQVDANEDIRTWTILVISRLSKKLSSSSNRSGILSTAFTKSLKDPSVKPRLAALYGLEDSLDLFDANTIANKVLTVIGPGILDKNIQVRTKARTLFQLYLSKLEQEADKISTDGAENVDINLDADIDDQNDDLVKGFLENLRISPAPLNLSAAEGILPGQNLDISTSDWDKTSVDDWVADDDGWGSESLAKEVDNRSSPAPTAFDKNRIKGPQTFPLSVDKKPFKKVLDKNVVSQPAASKVKINKSWNDDLNDDAWNDSWSETPEKSNNRPTISLPKDKRVHKLGTTNKFASFGNPKKTETKDVFEQLANDMGDDDWGDDW